MHCSRGCNDDWTAYWIPNGRASKSQEQKRVFYRTTRPAISQFFMPRDQAINEFSVVQERRSTDFEAPKVVKGLVGTLIFSYLRFHPADS